MDETCKHGSSTIAELVARGLERVADVCRQRGRRFPSTFLLLGDNTVRESKNQWVLKYISNLVGRRKLRLAGMAFLRKSHTHDRIDQLWGIVARRIANQDSMLDAQSVVEIVKMELERPGIRAWIGAHTQLHVQKLDATRNWRDNWLAQGITLEGGLLEDATANHVFMMMARKGSVFQTPNLN